MEKIASFQVNHLALLPGLYVSRVDAVGAQRVTTFDLRMTAPNREPVMGTGEMHAIEHLGATYLRNEPQWKDRVIYFGPMGCRTGFYLLLGGRAFAAGRVWPRARHARFHHRLRGRDSRGQRPRLRQLSGHEPSHGQILRPPLPRRSVRPDRRNAHALPGLVFT